MTDTKEDVIQNLVGIMNFYYRNEQRNSAMMSSFRVYKDYLAHFDISVVEFNCSSRTICYKLGSSVYEEWAITDFVNHFFDPAQVRDYTINQIIK